AAAAVQRADRRRSGIDRERHGQPRGRGRGDRVRGIAVFHADRRARREIDRLRRLGDAERLLRLRRRRIGRVAGLGRIDLGGSGGCIGDVGGGGGGGERTHGGRRRVDRQDDGQARRRGGRDHVSRIAELGVDRSGRSEADRLCRLADREGLLRQRGGI